MQPPYLAPQQQPYDPRFQQLQIFQPTSFSPYPAHLAPQQQGYYTQPAFNPGFQQQYQGVHPAAFAPFPTQHPFNYNPGLLEELQRLEQLYHMIQLAILNHRNSFNFQHFPTPNAGGWVPPNTMPQGYSLFNPNHEQGRGRGRGGRGRG